jgi:glycine/D-amino acid oxidase-like deaminating enzyme
MPKFECGWKSTLPAAPLPLVLEGPRKVSFAVLGAGFTGLACARRLAELYPDKEVAVLESERVGDGNSGRNSGFLMHTSFYADDPPSVHSARNRLQKAGLDEIRRTVGAHRITCDWQPWGNLYGALTVQEEHHLDDRAAPPYRAAGETLEEWSASEMEAATGSPSFRRGLFHRGSVLVQPVALVRGLAQTLPPNVNLFELSLALSIVRHRSTFRIQTPSGWLDADKVFICVNGDIPAFGYGANRLVKVATFAALSSPLDLDDKGLGSSEAFGLLPSFLGGPTIRKTRDNRLLVRDHFAFAPDRDIPSEAIYDFIRKAHSIVGFRWPDNGHVDFDFVWGGIMVLTRNSGRFFGEVADGLFLSACCNGAGNTFGTASGKLLAELAAGLRTPLLDDQMAIPHPSWVPPKFVLRHFVNRQLSAAAERMATAHQ